MLQFKIIKRSFFRGICDLNVLKNLFRLHKKTHYWSNKRKCSTHYLLWQGVSDLFVIGLTHSELIFQFIRMITLGMLYLVTNKVRKTSFCKGLLFSNNTKILLFISNAHSYVPIKLCRVAESIHLFQIKGRLNPENVKLKKNWIWDVLEIDWSDVSITLNDNEINLPRSVIIPFKERYRARKTS